MFGATEAKLLEAFFWLAAVALVAWPLFPNSAPAATWQDQAKWLAQIALAATAGLIFTLRRIRPDRHAHKLGVVILVLIVFLLCLEGWSMFAPVIPVSR